MTSSGHGEIFLGPILLDFDGPIAHAFAGLPAHLIAADLVEALKARAVEIPAEVDDQCDPMEVLRWTGTLGDPESMRVIEDALCEAELRALSVAEPTEHAHELIETAARAGRSVSIVSNNSAESIRLYLERHGLADLVDPIIGRALYRPDEMKPNPTPILKAVVAARAAPADCVLIGDSLTDIQGAHAAGVRIIGYANKPDKVSSFRRAGADVIITNMGQVAPLLGLR